MQNNRGRMEGGGGGRKGGEARNESGPGPAQVQLQNNRGRMAGEGGGEERGERQEMNLVQVQLRSS